MTIINLINLLDSTFVTSFKHTARELYSVSFETSNVLRTVEKLKELEYNVKSNISTGKHVGAQIDAGDVNLVIMTLNALIMRYELIHNINTIPSNLKLHQMLKVIRENEKPEVVAAAKEVVSEIFKPAKTVKKLTKKQDLAESVSKKSLERKMKIFKKLGKQGN